MVNCGSMILNGCEPFTTPNRSADTFVIALPSTLASVAPASIVALALTDGESCAAPGFVTLNCMTYVVPAVSPALDTTTDRLPGPAVQFPLVSNPPDPPGVTPSAESSGVPDPVSPDTVTIDPAAKSQFVTSDTVIALLTCQIGLLCSITCTVKIGSITFKGSVPFATPRRFPLSFVIACGAALASSDPASTVAAMLTDGDTWAARGPGLSTGTSRVPVATFHAPDEPTPPPPPSEMSKDATFESEPVSPEMVSVDPAAKSQLVCTDT
eukprot:1269517-Rhodomonas_salina.1